MGSGTSSLILAGAGSYLAIGALAARQAWRVAPPPVRPLAVTGMVALFFACGVLAGTQAALPVPILALLGLAAWNCLYPPQLSPGDLSLYLWQPFIWQWMALYAIFAVMAHARGGSPPGRDGEG